MPSDFTEYFDLREVSTSAAPRPHLGRTSAAPRPHLCATCLVCVAQYGVQRAARVALHSHQSVLPKAAAAGGDGLGAGPSAQMAGSQRACSQEEMGWKRDFNRLVSGMHAVVDCEIIEDIGLSEEGRCEYRRPLDDERGLHPPPDNSFLAQFLTPGGFATSRARFSTCTMPTCSPSPPSARCVPRLHLGFISASSRPHLGRTSAASHLNLLPYLGCTSRLHNARGRRRSSSPGPPGHPHRQAVSSSS